MSDRRNEEGARRRTGRYSEEQDDRFGAQELPARAMTPQAMTRGAWLPATADTTKARAMIRPITEAAAAKVTALAHTAALETPPPTRSNKGVCQ